MASIDPRVKAKAKMVSDDEITIIDTVRAIEGRLGVDKRAALKFLIETIVQNPRLKFYDKVVVQVPYGPYGSTLEPIIIHDPISNARMETRLRLMARSGSDAVKQRFPHDTCQLDKVRVGKEEIVSALDTQYSKWLAGSRWITKPSNQAGKPPSDERKWVLERALDYANNNYPSSQKNPISLTKFVRNNKFLTAVFPGKVQVLSVNKSNNERAYTKTYGISPRVIIEEISLFLKSKSRK